MSFRAVRFDTDASQADRWSDALIEAGALSVDVSDPAAGTAHEAPVFAEPGASGASFWAISRIDALFGEGVDAHEAVRRAAEAIGAPLPPCEARAVADQDWVRITQSQFGPIAIGERFWIVPTWSEPPERDALVLRLDPGLAFGTGSHATTRLCLEWLREAIAGGESVLDYGCGSGILAIAAAALGAGEVVGTDIDPQALVASRANARQNGVDARFVAPNALPQRTFDVVVANILAHPLILLAPALAARTRRGGRIALSGILAPQGGEVAASYTPWFTLAAGRRLDGWELVTGTRHDG